MDEHSILIERGSIRVRWWDPADPVETVILLHGGPGLSARYLEPVVPFIDNEARRIVTYDQRGTGQSPCDSDDPADFGLDAYAADLTRVIESVGVGRVHLLGHSWGAIVAMDYAARHGDRIASIILVGSAPPNHAAVQVADASMTARVAELQERGLIATVLPADEDSTEALRAILPMYLGDPTLAMPAEAVRALEVTPGIGDLTWQASASSTLPTRCARTAGRHWSSSGRPIRSACRRPRPHAPPSRTASFATRSSNAAAICRGSRRRTGSSRCSTSSWVRDRPTLASRAVRPQVSVRYATNGTIDSR